MKRLLYFLVVFLAPAFSNSQEFIKEPQIKHDTSLVREVGYQEWLTYSFKQGNQSSFNMVFETGAIAQELFLPADCFVSDFEIYNDTVYFCGYKTTSPTVAIFGYFSLYMFPSTTVYCCTVHGLTEMNKIVVFNNNNRPHVVFTGRMQKSKYTVGEILQSAPNTWDFYVSTNLFNEMEVYDDVAVTNSYIVATGRDPLLENGYLHYFHKPTTYSSFASTNHLYRTVEYSVTSPLLLTACQGDTLATLCESGAGYFVMSKYGALNDVLSLKSLAVGVSCWDINFNEDSRNVEVLIHDMLLKYGSSCLVHYDYALSGSAIVPAHRYKDDLLYSIDYLNHHTNCFIASGHEIHDEILRLYRYKYNEWHSCALPTSFSAERVENDGYHYEIYFGVMMTAEVAVPLECSSSTTSVSPICNN